MNKANELISNIPCKARSAGRSGLFVYIKNEDKIICVESRKNEVYNGRGSFEKTQIPRGGTFLNEPSFIGALREFTEETHLFLRGTFYVYKVPFKLKWQDNMMWYTYKIWILIAEESVNCSRVSLSRFIFKCKNECDLWDFKAPYIYFGSATSIHQIENLKKPEPVKYEPLPKHCLEIIKLGGTPNKYDLQYSTQFVKYEKFVDQKLEENVTLLHNYEEFFAFVSKTINRNLTDDDFYQITIE